MLKKIITALLTVVMIATLGAGSVFAKDPVTPTDGGKSFEQKVKDGEIKVKATFVPDKTDSGAQPYYWPGSGAAPGLSSIQGHDAYIRNDGHLVSVLKVMGYGTDLCKFEGNRVRWYKSDAFVLFGTLADGFYDYFDLGLITHTGRYYFDVRYRSSASPYDEISGTLTYDIS